MRKLKKVLMFPLLTVAALVLSACTGKYRSDSRGNTNTESIREESVSETTSKASELIKDGMDIVSDIADEGRDIVSEIADNGREIMSDLTQDKTQTHTETTGYSD